MDEAESKRHLEEMSKIIKERDEAERGRNLYRSFLYKDEVLGVLGLFTRIPIPEQGPAWLRIFADDIAVAFVNARAFEENDRLRARLELETAYLPEEVREAKSLGDIIGQSASLTDLQRQMDMVAPTDATVLILGEPAPARNWSPAKSTSAAAAARLADVRD